jgi:hypothetical protein
VITGQIPDATIKRLSETSRLVATVPQIGEQHTSVHESADGNPGRPVRVADLMDAPGKICWLAFCSGPALKREGRRIPLPGDLWKEYLSGTDFSDKTVPFDDALGLPRRIEVFTKGGQLLLQYQVRQSTNVLGWNVPPVHPRVVGSWERGLQAALA